MCQKYIITDFGSLTNKELYCPQIYSTQIKEKIKPDIHRYKDRKLSHM